MKNKTVAQYRYERFYTMIRQGCDIRSYPMTNARAVVAECAYTSFQERVFANFSGWTSIERKSRWLFLWQAKVMREDFFK